MDTYSNLILTFGADLTTETITFDYGVVGTSVQPVSETWGVQRIAAGQVIQGTPTGVAGVRSANNFVDAFNKDYNVTGLFKVSVSDNVVTIASTNYTVSFDNIVVPTGVTFQNNTETAVPFGVKAITYVAGANECNQLTVSVETWQQADSYRTSGAFDTAPIPVTTNPFTFVMARGITFNLDVILGANQQSEVVSMPRKFFLSNIDLDINDSPGGATMQASVNVLQTTSNWSELLSFEYSLNGTQWNTTGYFDNLLQGNYNLQVRDQFGCVKTKPFTIDGFGINSPFLVVSQANSFRFKNKVTWEDCGNYKNEENTLSHEEDVIKPKKELLLFQTCDIITTQFKSNYGSITANIRVKNPDGTLAVFGQAVEQKTNFMRRKDRRDALKFNLGDGTGRSGIYFTSGNIYDYDTGADIADYVLNGALPEWGRAGNYVKVGSSWLLIEDVIFVESRNAEVLVVSGIITIGSDVEFEASCFYNLHNYEVYEFTADMDAFMDKCFEVQILNSDLVFGDREHISELCHVKVRWENTLEVIYYNKNNTDIFYGTGIRHKMRLLKELVEADFTDDTDTHKTDTDTILLGETIHNLNKFTFQPVTTPRMRQIVAAVSHTEVFINGVQYVKDSVEKAGPLEDTNLYDVTASMILAKEVYNSDTGTLEYNDGTLEIPAIIDGGTGFVLYNN